MKNLKMPLKGKVIVELIITPAMQYAEQQERKKKSKIIVPDAIEKSVDDTFANEVQKFAEKFNDHPFVVRIIKATKESNFEPNDIGLVSMRKAGRIIDDMHTDFPTSFDVIMVDGERFAIFEEDFIVAINNDLKDRIKNGILIDK